MKKSSPKTVQSATNTQKHVSKFVIISIVLTLINFVIYTTIARFFLKDNNLLWIDSIISYSIATVFAYLLHSNITWKERPVDRRGIFMFFLWNGITAAIISPVFTWLFGFLTPLYLVVHSICSQISLPFDYNFIESTSIFVFTCIIVMILNYLFYDKFAFGTRKNSSKVTNNE